MRPLVPRPWLRLQWGPTRPAQARSAKSPAIPTREGAKRTILCLGDSLTFGTTSRAAPGFATLSQIEGYVPKLQRLLEDELDEKLTMVNSSRGGGDSNEGLTRLPKRTPAFTTPTWFCYGWASSISTRTIRLGSLGYARTSSR